MVFSGHEPYRRLRKFFQDLFNCLKKGGRAVLQFYPESGEQVFRGAAEVVVKTLFDQVEMITSAAMRSGFGGGLVVDFPHSSKAKKHFLVLYAGNRKSGRDIFKACVVTRVRAVLNTFFSGSLKLILSLIVILFEIPFVLEGGVDDDVRSL